MSSRRPDGMRDDPNLDLGKIAVSLDRGYGFHVTSVSFVPIGYDLNAAVYEVLSADGARYFLKVRFGPVDEAGLTVPRALVDHGIPNILGPLRTRSSALWHPLDDATRYSLSLYPFVRGENAMVAGMSDEQWRVFGSRLRAVHDSGLERDFADQLRVEDFALPSARVVCQLLATVDEWHSRVWPRRASPHSGVSMRRELRVSLPGRKSWVVRSRPGHSSACSATRTSTRQISSWVTTSGFT
jgi:hypothetical protein